jgi:hypothetical protein
MVLDIAAEVSTHTIREWSDNSGRTAPSGLPRANFRMRAGMSRNGCRIWIQFAKCQLVQSA